MRCHGVTIPGLLAMVLTATAACTPDGDQPVPRATASAAFSDAAAAASPQASASSTPSPAPTASDTAAAGENGGDEPACPVATRNPKRERAPFAADVDGDGRRDDVFFLEHPKVGVRTAAGGFSHFEVSSAKPFSLLGAEDANGDGRDELFVGRAYADEGGATAAVQVAVFVDCRMRLARNVDGEPYTFVEDGSRKRPRGMGCVVIDGVRRLVGLAGRELPDGRVRWKRTVVEMDGHHFTNGEVSRGIFTRPSDKKAIRLLGEMTCGEDDLAAHYGH